MRPFLTGGLSEKKIVTKTLLVTYKTKKVLSSNKIVYWLRTHV